MTSSCLNSCVVHWIYNSIICLVIAYGVIAWCSCTMTSIDKSELAKVQCIGESAQDAGLLPIISNIFLL